MRDHEWTPAGAGRERELQQFAQKTPYAQRQSGESSVEWPTIILAGVIYGGWLLLTFFHAALPAWFVYPALIWLVAWQGSLQHEVLHGHPTGSLPINDALGFTPLSLWLPYAIYRRSHLRHHQDERLTDPMDDPESYYWTPDLWNSLSTFGKLAVYAQTTFLGRLVIGPAWIVCRFLREQFGMVMRDEEDARALWGAHLLCVASLMVWLVGVCGFSPWLYVMGVVYPATSLLLIRSFAEHRAAAGVAQRIAIVENAPVLGLLFLNNNLHVVHHFWAAAPWYQIPALYRRHRARLLEVNGGLLYDGYVDVARRYLLTPHDAVLHPLGRAPEPGQAHVSG
jgi:fatty acid desaturase